MSHTLIERVKKSLAMRFYIMNDSWLTDCIEYYLNDHENPSQEDIISFVTNQWVLCDLREINNEKGCLPRNLAKQKCTMLPGKYILQLDKMYDISLSKYKQLEKIRNVSSENIQATEFENALEEGKSQTWEPKSKRMLQLFLTDGIQDILAIEYKPIRHLKDNLYPGFKVMIKGPVTCRKGVLLLEETNFVEVGGEVETLLISNAVENIFARALNLEENPDPYNDNNKQSVNSQNTQKIIQIEDDFDLDSEAIDQIDKQIQQQNSNNSKNSTIDSQKNKPIRVSQISNKTNNKQNMFSTNKLDNLVTSNLKNSSNNYKNKMQENQFSSVHNNLTKFQDDDDSFLEMIDDKALDQISAVSTVKHRSLTNKDLYSLSLNENHDNEDFPMEDKIYDMTEAQTPIFNDIQAQNKSPNIKSNLSDKPCSSKMMVDKFPSPLKPKEPLGSRFDEFPDDNFDLDDFDIRTDNIGNYLNKNSKNSLEYSQASTSKSLNLNKTNLKMQNFLYQNYSNNSSNSSDETHFEDYHLSESLENRLETKFNVGFDSEKEDEFKQTSIIQQKINIEKPRIEKIYKTSPVKLDNQGDNFSNNKITIGKRPSSSLSPIPDPYKVRCLQSPTASNESKTSLLLSENYIKICDFLCDVLKDPFPDEGTRTVVRGKVTKAIKLNLLKGANGSYFHLEGVITDYTANLDVVFSSQVLEKIIGYTPQEFSKKRRESKINPEVKEKLRDNLNKAQEILRYMDALMEIELKKTKKALIISTENLTEEQRKAVDAKVKMLKTDI